MRPKHIGVIGFDQVSALDLVGPAHAFVAAALDDGYGGRISCYKVSVIGVASDRFRAECGLKFEAEATLSNAPLLDTIIIAGGKGMPASAEKIARWLLKRDDWRRIGAICSGIYALAPTGLLDGRDVTTHARFARDVARRFPRLQLSANKRFVQDGPYYTAGGLSAAIDFSLAMIEEDYGPSVARSVERELALHQPQPAAADVPTNGTHLDSYPIDRFADLMAWLLRNLHGDLSLDVLARRVCMCPGHFSKVFKSVFGEAPTDFVSNLRLNEARRRLSKRQKTLRTVAASVGYTSPAAFERAFERRFGVRPNSYFEKSPLERNSGTNIAPWVPDVAA